MSVLGGGCHTGVTFCSETVLHAFFFLKAPLPTFTFIILWCFSGLMSTLPTEMQTSTLDPQFIVGPQGKVPGRKRGRPPIRKLEFQSHYMETLSPLKVPKKRGRKPGFKVSQSLYDLHF